MRVKKVEVYVITDPRAFEPDCGHHSSKDMAYGELASKIIYDRERRTGIYADYNNEEELDRVCRLESRLARYLQWLDSKEKPIHTNANRLSERTAKCLEW
jgi:hypothetical protein